MTQLRAAFRLTADWWSDLGEAGQSAYIENHPQSKKAKEAKEKEEKTGKEPAKESPKTKKGEPESKTGEPSSSPAEEQKRDKAVDEKPKQKQKPLAPGKPLSAYAKAKDDPNINVEKIYSNFKPEDVQEMKDKTAEAMILAPSDKKYADAHGNYTPERKALHAKILRSVLTPERMKAATPAPGTKPTFIVLGGRGGSGKSSFTSDEHTGKPATVNEFDSTKFLTLDADAVKEMLDPPYEGWNANQVHEESSYVFDQIMKAAQDKGLNIISDATLKSNKMGPTLKAMQDKGYDIEGHYMYLPRQKAAARACGRYLKDGPQNRGRLVPPEVILGNTNNEDNFDQLKPFFKRWSAYDNDQPKGTPPQLIDHSDYADAAAAQNGKEGVQSKTKTKTNKTQSRVNKMIHTTRDQKDVTTAADGDEAGANEHGYTADSWENDPFLTPNPEREKKVDAGRFETLRMLGTRTSQVPDPETRKAYIQYLKSL